MKLRHTAAFLLVGWYLIWPPLNKTDAHGFRHPNPIAPITEWYFEGLTPSSWQTTARKHAKLFGSLAKCEERIENHRDEFLAFKKLFDKHESVPDSMFEGLASGDWQMTVRNLQCVSSDDPRLKSK